MNPETPPESIPVTLSALADVGVECWRMGRMAGAAAGPARHSLRRIEDFLKRCELEVQALDGRAFDAGLAARVVDAIDDPALPEGQSVIAQTLQPMVLWRGIVIRPADVITRRGTLKPTNAGE